MYSILKTVPQSMTCKEPVCASCANSPSSFFSAESAVSRKPSVMRLSHKICTAVSGSGPAYFYHLEPFQCGSHSYLLVLNLR